MTRRSNVDLLAIAVLVTLAVTLLRLAGELQGWSPILFSRQPGGLGGLVGIIWLAPVFGVYCARRLRYLGEAPKSVRRPFLYSLSAVAVWLAWAIPNVLIWPAFQLQVLGAATASVVVVGLQLRAWPELARTLLLYAVGARAPVVVLMYFAIVGRWGTHYDAFPAGFPLTDPVQMWFWAGLLVQMTFWIAATVVLGTLCGLVSLAIGNRTAHLPSTTPEQQRPI